MKGTESGHVLPGENSSLMCPKTCSAAPLPIQLPFLGMPGHTRAGRRRPRGHPLTSEVVGRGEEVIVSGSLELGGVPGGLAGLAPAGAAPAAGPARRPGHGHAGRARPARAASTWPPARGRSRWRWSRGSPRTPRAQLSPGKHLRCACAHASSHAWGRTLSACPRIGPEHLSTALAAEFASPLERLQRHDPERLHASCQPMPPSYASGLLHVQERQHPATEQAVKVET